LERFALLAITDISARAISFVNLISGQASTGHSGHQTRAVRLIESTALDPHSPCAPEARAGLARIAATLDQVDYAILANIATLDLAMKNRVGSGLMPIIELHLLAVGGGPTLDYESATAFFAQFKPLVDLARKPKIN
jgi:hypothetical protein